MRSTRSLLALAVAAALLILTGCLPVQSPRPTHVLLYMESAIVAPKDHRLPIEWQVVSCSIESGESTVVAAARAASGNIEVPQLSHDEQRLLHLAPSTTGDDAGGGGRLVELDLTTGETSTPIPQSVSSYGWAGKDIIACTLPSAISPDAAYPYTPPNAVLRVREGELATIIPAPDAIPRPTADGSSPLVREGDLGYMGAYQDDLYFLERDSWIRHTSPIRIWRLPQGAGELELVKDLRIDYGPYGSWDKPDTPRDFESMLANASEYRDFLAAGMMPILRQESLAEFVPLPGGSTSRTVAETTTVEVYDPASMNLLRSIETSAGYYGNDVIAGPAWSTGFDRYLEIRTVEGTSSLARGVFETRVATSSRVQLAKANIFPPYPMLAYVDATGAFVFTERPADAEFVVRYVDPMRNRESTLMRIEDADPAVSPGIAFIGLWTPPE